MHAAPPPSLSFSSSPPSPHDLHTEHPSYILNKPLWNPTPLAQDNSGKGWNHTTCCELRPILRLPRGSTTRDKLSACCGCLDNGVTYSLKHVLCLPFTFGTLSSIASDGEYSPLLCGAGICAGVTVGFGLLGQALLPCGVKVRRKTVEKYGMDESFGCSIVHVVCCPYASMIQTLMQVEEEENGTVEMFGVWREGRGTLDDDVGVWPGISGNGMEKGELWYDELDGGGRSPGEEEGTMYR